MNNRNVATKEISSVLDSEHGSASDISTRPEINWTFRAAAAGDSEKKTQKRTNEEKRKTKQQTSETKQQKKGVRLFFFPHRLWARKTWQVGKKTPPPGRQQAALGSASCTRRLGSSTHRKPSDGTGVHGRGSGTNVFFSPPTQTNKITSWSQTLVHRRRPAGATDDDGDIKCRSASLSWWSFYFPAAFYFLFFFFLATPDWKKLPTMPCCVHGWALIGGK